MFCSLSVVSFHHMMDVAGDFTLYRSNNPSTILSSTLGMESALGLKLNALIWM